MIDWQAFLIVAVVSVVASAVVVTLYAFGLRLLNVGRGPDADDGSAQPPEPSPSSAAGRPAWATVAAISCFTMCGAAILYGIYLIVPFFHR
jgi:hypothetical protein